MRAKGLRVRRVSLKSPRAKSIPKEVNRQTMPRKKKSMPAPTELALPANCSIRDVAALKTSLLAMLETTDTVVIDAQGVERIDTSSVQLLVAFARDRAAGSRALEWRGVDGAFGHALRVLGLEAAPGLPGHVS